MALPDDNAGALRVGPAVLHDATASGPLDGMSFVAKDLFAVAGQHTAAGSPDRLTDAFLADTNAPAIERLRAAGATLIGIAHQDELAYSLMGQNARMPNPTNPRAPGALTGG
jgi:amidase